VGFRSGSVLLLVPMTACPAVSELCG